MAKLDRHAQRKRRHRRIRRRILGTPERPRLAVHKSNRHLYAQVIDDLRGHTLAYASTLDPDLNGAPRRKSVESAQTLGELLAERAREAGVEQVVFDRAGYPYHGMIQALADSAREGGLEF